MVIDSNNSVNGTGIGASKGRASPAANQEPNRQSQVIAHKAGTDQGSVNLSGQGQALNQLEANISAQSEVNQGRVEAIKLAIANGSFQINPERIAENMLKQEDLLS